MAGSFHESYDRSGPPLPSDRSTGLVFAAIAFIVAYLWRSHGLVPVAAFGVAAMLTIVSLAVPNVLHPLNVTWMRFAHLLSKVMNPVVTLALFAVAIIPAGLLVRRWHDPMRRRRSGKEASYWILRQPHEHSSMRNQF